MAAKKCSVSGRSEIRAERVRVRGARDVEYGVRDAEVDAIEVSVKEVPNEEFCGSNVCDPEGDDSDVVGEVFVEDLALGGVRQPLRELVAKATVSISV